MRRCSVDEPAGAQVGTNKYDNVRIAMNTRRYHPGAGAKLGKIANQVLSAQPRPTTATRVGWPPLGRRSEGHGPIDVPHATAVRVTDMSPEPAKVTSPCRGRGRQLRLLPP